MCLYPRLIANRKYKVNKKNGGDVPIPKDKRVLLVPVGCGKCIECMKQRSRQWSVRLQEEIRDNTIGQFVTLTFSNESIKKLHKDLGPGLNGYELDNEIAKLGVRRFLERWRKKYKTSVKHWLVTELGGNGTENIHLHGIIFTKEKEEIEKIWNYGFVYIGKYVNEKTVNYCCKYVTQIDEIHKEYKPVILTSPGIGKNYTNRYDATQNKYKEGGETSETYYTRQRRQINLPIYYRNKIYTEEEREKLWLEKLDKQERWVLGTKISLKNGPEKYHQALKHAQAKNKLLGYGDNSINWDRINYENKLREINIQKRLDNTENDRKFET